MNCGKVKFGLAVEKRDPSIHSVGKMQWKLGDATLLVTFKNRIDQIFVKIYCSCSSTVLFVLHYASCGANTQQEGVPIPMKTQRAGVCRAWRGKAK